MQELLLQFLEARLALSQRHLGPTLRGYVRQRLEHRHGAPVRRALQHLVRGDHQLAAVTGGLPQVADPLAVALQRRLDLGPWRREDGAEQLVRHAPRGFPFRPAEEALAPRRPVEQCRRIARHERAEVQRGQCPTQPRLALPDRRLGRPPFLPRPGQRRADRLEFAHRTGERPRAASPAPGAQPRPRAP